MENRKLKDRADSISGIVDELVEEIEHWENEHGDLESKYDDGVEEIRILNEQLSDAKEEIKQLNEQLEEANDTINDLRVHIKNP